MHKFLIKILETLNGRTSKTVDISNDAKRFKICANKELFRGSHHRAFSTFSLDPPGYSARPCIDKSL